MAEKQRDKEKTLRVNIPPELRKGVYCNLASIHHTSNEFIIDFVFAHVDQGELVSRVITSPAHAKGLLSALHDNVEKFEKRFGEIEGSDQDKDIPDLVH